jgi:hypothetical protein
MNGSCADPCNPQSLVQRLQAAIGDDWGWTFQYLGSDNQPITIGPDEVIGTLYTPFQTTPVSLDLPSGRAKVVDQPPISFVLGLEEAVTATLTPDVNPPATHLQIQRQEATSGLLRTIGHFDLTLLKGNSTPQPMRSPFGYRDPLSGEQVILTGYTTVVPVPP